MTLHIWIIDACNMIIKRNIYFALKIRRNAKGERLEKNLPIRMRISYNWNYKDFYTGYNIDLDQWDKEHQRVKRNTINQCGQTASVINSHLSKMLAAMYDTFNEFEILDKMPDLELLTARFKEKMDGVNVALKSLTPHKPKVNFWNIYRLFITETAQKRAWTTATIEKFMTLKRHIQKYKEFPTFEDFKESGLTAFVTSLRSERKVLKNGKEWTMKDTTVLKQVGYLKWFLKWAVRKGYTDINDYVTFNPKLKASSKRIIFLTLDEIKKLSDFKIPDNHPAWERIRDVCIFCCFSGLRHSDVYNLKKTDIINDCIDFTSQKDSEHLRIELNWVTRKIIEKYKDCKFKDNKLLPVISNTKTNIQLKSLFKAAGFNELLTDVSYRGGQRIEHTYEKWTKIGTHVGRKSFICNALALGVPVNVVMKWTGHSDYKAMKPYIDVADSIKAHYMHKLDINIKDYISF